LQTLIQAATATVQVAVPAVALTMLRVRTARVSLLLGLARVKSRRRRGKSGIGAPSARTGQPVMERLIIEHTQTWKVPAVLTTHPFSPISTGPHQAYFMSMGPTELMQQNLGSVSKLFVYASSAIFLSLLP